MINEAFPAASQPFRITLTTIAQVQLRLVILEREPEKMEYLSLCIRLPGLCVYLIASDTDSDTDSHLDDSVEEKEEGKPMKKKRASEDRKRKMYQSIKILQFKKTVGCIYFWA